MIAELGVSAPPATQAGPAERVRISAQASDPLTSLGLARALGTADGLSVVDGPGEAEVAIFGIERVDRVALAALRRWTASTAAPVVLLTAEPGVPDPLALVECRVVEILLRSTTTAERLAEAASAAGRRGGALPPDLLGRLLRRAEEIKQEARRPLDAAELTEREREVVRLLAEGCGTKEIGERLRYSERTVKNVISAAASRLNARNRTQLTARAMRAGVI